MRDVVVVGGGLAGLAAAWRLRHRDALLLESESRVGGRIRSERRGRYWLNWGAHVFAGPGSATDALLSETGVAAAPVPGTPAALAMNGKLLLTGPLATFPFRVPMPLPARLALVRAGIKVSAQVLRYARVVRQRPGEDPARRQQRIYDFENDRSFQDFVGDLPEDAGALFYPTVTRSAGDPHEISAGSGIGYFSLVWNIGEGLSRNIIGGPSTLTDGIAAALGDERARRPWDGVYGIATPKRSFNIVLNQAGLARSGEPERRPGGSIMVFSPAGLGRALLGRTDEEILRGYTRDLDEVLGAGFGESVVEARVQRWETGSPYCFPGRAALQPTLTRRGGRVILAGDYLGTLYTETATATGFSAAQQAATLLATEPTPQRSY